MPIEFKTIGSSPMGFQGHKSQRTVVESLIPDDKELRRILRSQWTRPSNNQNKLPIRYIEEGNNAHQYFVVAWNGASVVTALREGRYENLNLDTLARRNVFIDGGWDSSKTIGDYFTDNLAFSPINESKVHRGLKSVDPTWIVCRGVHKHLDAKTYRVEEQISWCAYPEGMDIPITMMEYCRIPAKSEREAVESGIRKYRVESDCHSCESEQLRNSTDRHGGVSLVEDMLNIRGRREG